MELIKKKILLEDFISRKPGPTYGTMTASNFYIKVQLVQTIDDMGMYTDVDYVSETPDYSILIQKLVSSGITFPFMAGPPAPVPVTGYTKNLRLDNLTVGDYTGQTSLITGTTNSKIEKVRSYNINNPFIPGFDVLQEKYINYRGDTVVNGVSRVLSLAGPTGYTFDVDNADSNVGTSLQEYGIYYREFDDFKVVLNPDTQKFESTRLVRFSTQGQGWNETNASLSALTKEEIFLGIVFPQEVKSDVFIDRGATNVFEPHLRLSEIESLEHLTRYGNGFYNINKQT